MFLTSRLRDLLIGGFRIRDRRRKPDEPFNPFAANANQVRQKNETNEVKTMHRAQVDKVVPIPAQILMRMISEKARRSKEKLGAQSSPTAPITQKPAINANTLNAKADNQAVQQVSRADRLAELRKQSQESVKKTESILEPEAPVLTPAPQAIVEDVIEKQEQDNVEESTVVESDNETTVEDNKSSKNVFKQIVTNTPKKRDNRRRRSRHDDSGGGRQPKVKKLNRQKYNDYKYAARDILDDDRVADEHRSNLLGQIWAKGERIGVEATLEFISEKEEQLIINEEIAQRLRDLVKALTTRR